MLCMSLQRNTVFRRRYNTHLCTTTTATRSFDRSSKRGELRQRQKQTRKQKTPTYDDPPSTPSSSSGSPLRRPHPPPPFYNLLPPSPFLYNSPSHPPPPLPLASQLTSSAPPTATTMEARHSSAGKSVRSSSATLSHEREREWRASCTRVRSVKAQSNMEHVVLRACIVYVRVYVSVGVWGGDNSGV